MSNSKMLIDASHPEETRVVVLKGNRIEEFDFESASKKQLRGNIYLAKVTRVEPSLQAAFVEYGGNRHGFLAFSEIHPDYYQIPFADRQALLEEEARAHRDEEDEPRESRGGGRGGENRGGEGRSRDGRRGGESRGGGENRSAGEGGEGRTERGARGDGRDGRQDRNDRGGRNERGQRRSRRHRRDAAAPMDRRGPADESISESALETGEAAELIGVDAGIDDGAPQDGGSEAYDTREIEVVTEGHDTDAAAVQAGQADDQSDDRDDPAADEAGAGAADTEGTVAGAPEVGPATEAPAEPELPLVAAAPDGEAAAAIASPAEVMVAAGKSYVAESHADEAATGEADEREDGGETATVPVSPAEDHDAAEEAYTAEAETPPDVGALEARDAPEHHDDEHHEEEHVEQIGGDALSDVAPRPMRLRRHYKIQEVIKRRQILLIQVVKEERGNKGAALTTYLSLAGRYSVLMPNTAKGGGISRKITDGEDRKRLKAIAGELDVPEGMGVILRTAGAARSPIEVKRDFEYLLRMWESVRELTLKSSAPSLVYEEGSLIKRSIRDLYSKEVEEIVVSGEEGFTEARDFMRMLMPGNVKSVSSYRDPQPIFAKSGVEAQLDAMFSPHVTLKSGGYLVINQTEALVAIDVNSGRSTREHNIEDTALRTNMEAADEVARQLRLRDLAGLIVVDFIDMEEGRNNRAVERRIKEALKNDRARIQIGRISHFGLLEMSRQRIRTGVLEGSTVVCPHCAGAGTVRSTASIALHVLRLVEDALLKDASHDLIVRSRAEVALYMLNQKRAKLVELEQRFGVTLTVDADPTLTGMVYHAIERGDPATPAIAPVPRQDLVRVDSIAPIFEAGSEDEDEGIEAAEPLDGGEAEGADEGTETASGAEAGDGDGRRRKRRRRRRGRDREGASEIAADGPQPPDDGLAVMADIGGDLTPVGEIADASGEDGSIAPPSQDGVSGALGAPAIAAETAAIEMPAIEPASDAVVTAVEPPAEEAPKRRRSRRTAAPVETEGSVAVAASEEEVPARPRRRRPSRARASGGETVEVSALAAEAEPVGSRPSADRDVGADTVEHHAPLTEAEVPVAADLTVETMDEVAEAQAAADPSPAAPTAMPDPDRPKRSGWWQRAKASFGS